MRREAADDFRRDEIRPSLESWDYNVRYGSQADILEGLRGVRFTPVSSTGRRNTTRWSAPAVVLEQFLH